MNFTSPHRIRSRIGIAWIVCILGLNPCLGWAQGPTPETGNTIFPGGGLFSYGADFISRKAPPLPGGSSITPTVRPTSEITQPLIFIWGIRRDLELLAITSISSNHLNLPGPSTPLPAGGLGMGDSLMLLKYRFLRLDSQRGTTQASITIGPKIPT